MPVHSVALENALRVQPEEHLAQAFVLLADQAIGRHFDVVEEQLELLLRRADLDRDERALEPGRVGVDDEQRQSGASGLGIAAGARHDKYRGCFVDPRDVGLRTAHAIDVAVARRGGRQVVRVRPRVGFGDREHHLLAGREPGEPALLLRVGTEPRHHLSADPRRHEDEQERTPLRRQLLLHDRQLAHPPATAAVLLRQVHAEEARRRHRHPELAGAPTGPGAFGEVLVPEPRSDAADRLAQHLVLGRFGEVHCVTPGRLPPA